MQNGSTKKDKLIIDLFDYGAYKLNAQTNKRSDDYGGYELSKIILKNLVTYNKATPDIRFGEGVGYTITSNTFNTVSIPWLTTKGVQTEGDLLVCAEDGSLTLKVTQDELEYNGKILADSLKIGNNSDGRYAEITQDAKLNIGSLEVTDTSTILGDTFSDKFKPINDKVGKLGDTDKRFAYGYINEIIFDNHIGGMPPAIAPTFDVTLKASTYDSGFKLTEDGYYTSTNKFKNTSSLCCITVNNPNNTEVKLAIDCINYGYRQDAFGKFSKLDNQTSSYKSFDSYLSSEAFVPTIIYYTIPPGTHEIWVSYNIYNPTEVTYDWGLTFKPYFEYAGDSNIKDAYIGKNSNKIENPTTLTKGYWSLDFILDNFPNTINTDAKHRIVTKDTLAPIAGAPWFKINGSSASTFKNCVIGESEQNYTSVKYEQYRIQYTEQGGRVITSTGTMYNAKDCYIEFLEENDTALAVMSLYSEKYDNSSNFYIISKDNIYIHSDKNITLDSKIKSQLTPTEDNKYNLGSGSAGWKNAYVNKLYFRTNQEGTDGKPLNLRPLRVNTSS